MKTSLSVSASAMPRIPVTRKMISHTKHAYSFDDANSLLEDENGLFHPRKASDFPDISENQLAATPIVAVPTSDVSGPQITSSQNGMRLSSASVPKTSTKAQKQQDEYADYLELANSKDFSNLHALKILYVAGTDALDRPIVVLMLRNLPMKEVDPSHLLLFFINVLDKIVENEYILIFVNSKVTTENKPTFSWLQKVYHIFNRKYKKNLKALYMIYPTFWIKLIFRLFKPFISSKFWKKLVYIEEINELFKYIDKKMMDLPEEVLNYRTNGVPENKVKPMFGASLEEVLALENNPTGIPTVVEKSVQYLLQRATRVEGIFRLSGSSTNIDEIRKAFDRGDNVNLLQYEDPHAIAGMLKLFLRELKDPAFPIDFYDTCISTQTASSGNTEAWVPSVRALLSNLPAQNRLLLSFLFSMLACIAANSDVNKMTPDNLSIVFAPNLLRARSLTISQVMIDSPIINAFVRDMIIHQAALFV
eukprot:TRINITY_DN3383_c0_g1_i1.p1 TRINITY_DN3383_c0_g1~~TRINITY_DN3383_c0_g1_i1.p1  ORF type:complete len:477 (+),score=79.39 TRINITY_DN3383_c0_g1_i1:168-1598(+)